MPEVNGNIRPEDVGITPDATCLTHTLKTFPHEIAARFADEALKGIEFTDESGKQLRRQISDKIAASFYMGAAQETMLTNQSIEKLFRLAEEERTFGIRYYRNQIAAVCKNAILYAKESVRDDYGHQGRMAQRENALKSAIDSTVEAWNGRFRRRQYR